jgi:hypothetical protein
VNESSQRSKGDSFTLFPSNPGCAARSLSARYFCSCEIGSSTASNSSTTAATSRGSVPSSTSCCPQRLTTPARPATKPRATAFGPNCSHFPGTVVGQSRGQDRTSTDSYTPEENTAEQVFSSTTRKLGSSFRRFKSSRSDPEHLQMRNLAALSQSWCQRRMGAGIDAVPFPAWAPGRVAGYGRRPTRSARPVTSLF